MRRFAIVVLLALAAAPSLALEPYLVKDINQLPAPASSYPMLFAAFEGAAFFSADDGVSGSELWRSDGTEAGTWLVSDTCAPDCPGSPRPFAVTPDLYFFLGERDNRTLWVTGGDAASTFRLTDAWVDIPEPVWVPSQRVLYFVARDAAHGKELWRSDGTPAGTHMVADLRPGPQDSGVFYLAELGGKVYFNTDRGLWRTDGTAQGTVLVKALAGGTGRIQVFGSRLFFPAVMPSRGIELWRSDGTDKGTAMLADIAPGKASTELRSFVVLGKRLFFLARTAAAGQQLWVTDGTSAGTRSLTRGTGATPYEPPVALLGGRLVFPAMHPRSGVELWTTDGTPKGTRLLRDLCPGTCSGFQGTMLSAIQGRLFFSGTVPGKGTEPWVSDGTPAGTRLVRDLCPGVCASDPLTPILLGQRVLFVANDGVHGYQLWATDTSGSGTARVTGFGPRQSVVSYHNGAVVGGKLLFSAPDDLHGEELWRTDGTAAGTALVRDINRADHGGASINLIGAAGDTVFFYAQDGERGHELWKSDGTEAGTALVHELVPGEEPRELNIYNEVADADGDRLFFLRRVQGQFTLWTSDGTAAGTRQLSGPGRVVVGYSELRTAGGNAFFMGGENPGDPELWASDGTVAGTREVKDAGFRELRSFTELDGKLWFLARTSSSGSFELWRSDGTAAGTLRFDDLLPGDLSNVWNLTAHDGRLWFLADDGVHGRELWSTDGTAAGTRLELDTLPGPAYLSMGQMAFVDDRLFFVVDAGGEAGLWVSDFTAAGTRRVSPLQVLRFWAGFQGRVYFAVSRFYASSTAWVSDGTEEGTVPLLDRDGHEVLSPVDAAVLGDTLLFTTSEFGTSLWETDGTQAGTVRLRDLATNGTSGAWLLTEAGPRVFFGSHDPEHGYELWAVEDE